MITRNHRFHGRGSLRHVYQHGKTVRSPELGLRFGLHDHRRTFRLAVVVSKSISKSAVVRNRIRRRLYETVRLQSTAIIRPYDLVITVYKASILDMSSAQLTATIEQLLRSANIIEKPTEGSPGTHAIIDTKEN